MRVRRRRLRGASASGTRMTTSPWSPTENGCTEWARCERRSVGMPSLSNRLFTTTASARSQRCTATRLRESRGSGGRVGKRITFPRRVIGQSIVRRRRTRGRARAGPISPRAYRGSDVQSGPGPEPSGREVPMEKFEYFSGTPEVGIVPRAPHAGPLVRQVYEQEHGRGGFAGKVTHSYHLYPPTNWLPAETRVLDGHVWAPHWDSPLGPIGGTHHLLNVMPPDTPRGVYRGLARLVANATVAMHVTAPRASMDYFLEHHSATLVFLR